MGAGLSAPETPVVRADWTGLIGRDRLGWAGPDFSQKNLARAGGAAVLGLQGVRCRLQFAAKEPALPRWAGMAFSERTAQSAA
jgi:hypothetical protein